MTSPTEKHIADSIADDVLRNGYERWLRLEEAKAEIADDLKELMAELKGQGFTPKALRESFRRVRNADSADQQEHDAIVDLYVTSLTRARPAHTRETRSYAEEKGREDTIGISDPVSRDDMGITISVQSHDAAVVSATASLASDESEAPAHKTADNLAADNGDMDRGSFPVGGPTNSHSPATPAQSPQANTTDEAVKSSAASSVNPLCARPDTCQFAHSMASCSACAHAKSRAAV